MTLHSATGATDTRSDALLDDLSELHHLHERGQLSTDELRRAIHDRLRRN